ncbi:hypothetical protein ACFO9Q_17145 [Paenibacillus sp. GCM10023252]|uniref:hypothetical protein n=1 Tax=Paenibacillus sp. GCM10023252 TaxID=3252649 RepID=UPI00361748DE
MEDLIALIVNNLYLVFVLGGILLTLISKAGAKRKGSNPRMPDFGGGGMPNPMRRLDEPSHHEPGRPSPSTSEMTAPTSFKVKAQPPQGTTTPRSFTAAAAPSGFAAPARSSEEDEQGHNQDESARVTLEGSELRRAVIWAEVLSQPRAKRPYGK